jgi:twinkle protein
MGDVVNPKIVAWFRKRGIREETVVGAGIYSGEWLEHENGGKVVRPAADGRVVVFPFQHNGNVVNEKYRWGNKQFAQRRDGKKTFFNSDVLDSEALISGDQPLVITEGEMDALSVMEAGHRWVVSVPDGAPPARDANGVIIKVPDDASDIDPEHDAKYLFILANFDRLSKIKRIVIATDGDEAGERLAAELVRRLGRVRCSRVTYPKDPVVRSAQGAMRPCKDMNDVLMELGSARIYQLIHDAKPYPVSGVYRLTEFPVEPPLRFVSTGIDALDGYVKLSHPSFVVVTGKAGAGKSTLTMQIAARVSEMQGWTVALASFEMRIRPYVTNALSAAILRKPSQYWSAQDIEEADAWIEEHVVFIAPEPSSDVAHDIAWLIERMKVAVIRHGVRMFVIDPWNEIEHFPDKGETMEQYTGRAIRMLKTFGREYDCCIVVVAHPTKKGAEKAAIDVSLYDVSDSAHFANKADVGIVVARDGQTSKVVVTKIRYQPEGGNPDMVELRFDAEERRFVSTEYNAGYFGPVDRSFD